jgi:nicotinamide-nucleotide amidase
MTALRANMVVVGSEILEGRVHEANVPVVSGALRDAGVSLDGVRIEHDDRAAIVAALSAALAAPRARLVIVTGGTGGTWDDVTYAAVAEVTGRERTRSPDIMAALNEVVAWTTGAGYDLPQPALDSLLRIALVPEGAQVVVRDRWLVSVQVDVDGGIDAEGGASILVLPGPPGHCRRLVDEVLVGQLLNGRKSTDATVEITHAYPETLLTGSVLQVMKDFPTVRIGSYPGKPMILRVSGSSDEVDRAATAIRSAIDDLDAHPAAARLRRGWEATARWVADVGLEPVLHPDNASVPSKLVAGHAGAASDDRDRLR